jgi:hypothetical protein
MKVSRNLLIAVLALAAPATFAQTAASVTPNPNIQFLDTSTGAALPCVGCSVYTYAAGTSTPLATYTDSTGMTQNSNPIVLDSAGYSTSGIWVKGSCYKFVLENASSATVWTQDNVCDNSQLLKALLAGSTGAAQIGYEASGGVQTTVAGVLNETPLATSYASLSAALGTISSGQTLTVPKGTYSIGTGISVGTANLTLQCQPGAVIEAAASNITLIAATAANFVVDGCTFDGQLSQSSFSGLKLISGSAAGFLVRNSIFQNTSGSGIVATAGDIDVENVRLNGVGNNGTRAAALALGTTGSGLTNIVLRNVSCDSPTDDCAHILTQNSADPLTGGTVTNLSIQGFHATNLGFYGVEIQGPAFGVVNIADVSCSNFLLAGTGCISGLGGGCSQTAGTPTGSGCAQQVTISGIQSNQPPGSIVAGIPLEIYADNATVTGLSAVGPHLDLALFGGNGIHFQGFTYGQAGQEGAESNQTIFKCNGSFYSCNGTVIEDGTIYESYNGTIFSVQGANPGLTDQVIIRDLTEYRTPGIYGSDDTNHVVAMLAPSAVGGTITYKNINLVLNAAGSIPTGFNAYAFFAVTAFPSVLDGVTLTNLNAAPLGKLIVENCGQCFSGSTVRNSRVTNAQASSINQADVIDYADNLCLQGTNTNACGAAGGPGVDFTITNIPLTYSQLENAAGNTGNTHNITDGSVATWGSSVSGGGANAVGLRSNGSAWTVFAK